MTRKKKPSKSRLDLPLDSTMLQDPDPQPQPQPQPQSEVVLEEEEAPPPQPPEVATSAAAAAAGEDDGDGDDEGAAEPVTASPASPLADVAVPEIPPPNPPPPPPGSPQQKLALLKESFRPVPFAATAAPDFARHETLFRALGLWGFANLELDCEIRPDLVAQLIAYYDPPKRRSFVNDMRISVSRADLARALTLPVKKEKAGEGSCELQQELFAADESVAALLDFMSSFMLFQFQDDTCILPSEVASATQMVKEGQPQKVDWAGLMWGFVEKELLETPKSGVCYYASHLQCLMKCQHLRLFEEPEGKAKLEAVPENETSMEVEMDEEEDDNDGPMKTTSLDGSQEIAGEKHNTGLSLGLVADSNVADDFEQCKEGEEWRIEEENNGGSEHCFRRCTSSGFGSMEFENLSKVDAEGQEDGKFDGFSVKMDSLGRMNSTDLLQAMGTVNASFRIPENAHDPSSGEFLSIGPEAHKNVSMDRGQGGSYFFGNNGKRQIGEIDNEDDENIDHHFAPNNQPKRMRSNGVWEYSPLDFDACIEQVQSSLGKAKMFYAEKEQAYMNAQMELQYLNGILHQKDQFIHSLEKARMEEQQKWQMELCRFEHELNVMSQLVVGYKRALKQTRSAFADYRKKFPQSEEPLYSDVPGSGGVVLSTKELERQRLEKEEQMRLLLGEMIGEFQKEWLLKFEEFEPRLVAFERRIAELGEEMNILKEKFVKNRSSATSE
uniref:Uncharacterized protein n=1 Tax=Ananas comosus var. bracteatus TaxID=296719 RepID=A0A6V7QGJ1_ANACO|nr:unnamed protein product [Ananas comosus var. bracteatus]